MNTPFTTITGPAVPLMRPNVDTDVIIRIERLTTLDKTELGPYAFEALRRRPDGSEDPDCVLNAPCFRDAPVLLAAENFGCGSSREGAVWALQGIGVCCVIAPSYGDIFWNNCFQNGVLPITLPISQVQALATRCANGAAITVDLKARTVAAPDGNITPFTIDPLRREALLYGLDDIGLTLKDDELIREWQASDRQRRPWAWPSGRPRP
ncbi:3-isopropylmalate dehydratase small subunit [Cupriavidus oxalaticus]|uniref:3-isopropylmalate dehydratase n=1 Tax=Cupriavidus oxalaticus TaxID=96344 RepID=A0A375FMV2_9BURK|nr:3-isopropylmalate dehydratase small subunit [Cupriavidus oxalaticus]QRQ84291.1 3-isopropylmalate dehydratase small subunit [Cupriavidus oxalaticus]QRQ91623.1 3-isopropylmalate dehydratase small subunit [Cupriavidus oxalaticus]WQD86198.1 3-isopropylmalate dehydratase small subunit [Cupriavidus oxalaticus]SPC05110.1 3-isopropylmalate isomerase subunit [Cupriavidus oxalaticus]SPC18173.1 3-isopropylmalate isomerase subunit [Cupriavidus oxalaticus]